MSKEISDKEWGVDMRVPLDNVAAIAAHRALWLEMRRTDFQAGAIESERTSIARAMRRLRKAILKAGFVEDQSQGSPTFIREDWITKK